jgi:hypothetical protein
MFHTSRRVCVVILALAALGCEQLKSANPLSPQVAGPMQGIGISAPQPISPGGGTKIEDQSQPLSLVVLNPDTNSPRSIELSVQVAGDGGFGNIIYQRQGVAPAPGDRTIFQLDRLPAGRVYFWRSRADDGANDSGWGATASFEVLAPVTIGAPDPHSPIGNAQVAVVTPDLVIGNAPSSGPHGPIQYQYQVSDSQAFSNLIVNGQMNEMSGGETHFVTPPLSQLGQTLFWRARGFDSTHTGAWSRVESFRTPAQPTPSPAPSAGFGGGNLDTSNCEKYISDKPTLSQCVHDLVNPDSSVAAAFEVTKRIAWLLRSEGAGLLIKNGGDNIVSWKGYSFSAGRICYPDGHLFKVLSDVGGANGASWQDNGFVDSSLYVPAINPN